MPWTVADVDRFKRGLSPTQKRRWVRVANSALAACRADGGRDCEASAIRQANGVVGHKEQDMQRIVQANAEYEIRAVTQDGRKYIIVPSVMMVEGVHNGSAGRVFHSAQELARNVTMWENIPVTINHPQDEDDNFVSVQVTDGAAIVGEVHSARVDNQQLRSEIWLDAEELEDTSELAFAHIQAKQPLEVSVGVFTDDDNIKGIWNGEHYETVARNHRPDHLALLPGGTGACSWEDGCGVRINEKGGNDVKANKDHEQIKLLSMQGKAGWPVAVNAGYRELSELAQRELDRMDRQGRVHFLKEIFEDHLVYEIQRENEPSTLYRQDYTVNTNDGGFELTGEAVEVRRQVEYITVQEDDMSVRTKFNNLNNNKGMSEKKEVKTTPCCEERIDQLIANEQTRFAEKDKEWLMTLEEPQIEAMFPKEVEVKDEPPKVEQKKATKEEMIEVLKETMSKPEDYINLMPKEMQDQVRSALAVHKEQREGMIKEIIANTAENLWPEDDLRKMDTNTLVRIYNSVKKDEAKVGDYSILGVKPTVTTSAAGGEAPLDFPGMKVEKEAEVEQK